MQVELEIDHLHIEFTIDGAEESTLDWEGPSYSTSGYTKGKGTVHESHSNRIK